MDLILKPEVWDSLKMKLMERYPQLTASDMKHQEGMEKSMLRMVAYKLQKTKKELHEIIKIILC